MELQWYREHALPNSPMPIPVTARYMAQVCSGSIAGIVRLETHWRHACSSRVCHAESSLCDELITRSEQSYGMSNYVWSIHSQKMMRARFDLGCCATRKSGSIRSYTWTQISKDVDIKARQWTGCSLPSIKLIFSKYVLKGIVLILSFDAVRSPPKRNFI
jgi:hypothetical protein